MEKSVEDRFMEGVVIAVFRKQGKAFLMLSAFDLQHFGSGVIDVHHVSLPVDHQDGGTHIMQYAIGKVQFLFHGTTPFHP